MAKVETPKRRNAKIGALTPGVFFRFDFLTFRCFDSYSLFIIRHSTFAIGRVVYAFAPSEFVFRRPALNGSSKASAKL